MSALFPSPSSGFIPIPTEHGSADSLREMLDSRIANMKRSGSSSGSVGVSAGAAIDGDGDGEGEGNENKENNDGINVNNTYEQSTGRRSSAAHPLTPTSSASASASRSRPSSVILSASTTNLSSSSSSMLSGSSAAAKDSASRSSRRSSSSSRNSTHIDGLPVASLADLALQRSNSQNITSGSDAATTHLASSSSPTSSSFSSKAQQQQLLRHRSVSGDKARSSPSGTVTKRRSRKSSQEGNSGRTQEGESEASDEIFASTSTSSQPSSIRSGVRRPSSQKSTSTLTPSKHRERASAHRAADWDDADAEDDDDQRTFRYNDDELEASLSALPTPSASSPPVPASVLVHIRDYAFLTSDPRYRGELPDPEPISIPAIPMSTGYDRYRQVWQDSPSFPGLAGAFGNNINGSGSGAEQQLSTSVLSSSSSSSLSSSFTPPPFGSFGFGHAYHAPNGHDHDHHQQQQQQLSTSPQSLPSTGGKYSWNFVTDSNPRWSSSGRAGAAAAAGISNGYAGAGAGAASSSSTAGDNDSAFTSVTAMSSSSADTAMPRLLGSELSIEDFDEDFFDDDDGEDDEETENRDGEYGHGGTAATRAIPEGGLLYRAVYPFTAEAEQEMSLSEGGASFPLYCAVPRRVTHPLDVTALTDIVLRARVCALSRPGPRMGEAARRVDGRRQDAPVWGARRA